MLTIGISIHASQYMAFYVVKTAISSSSLFSVIYLIPI